MATQTYSDYMNQYQATKERQEQKQAQLVQQYSQRPERPANRFLWASTTVERYHVHNITPSDVFKTVLAVLGAGLFIVLSIILG